MRKKLPLIIVEWDDVSSFGGWEDTKESKALKPFQAKMVGWEISRNKSRLVLATAFSEDECNGRRVIPRGCIRSIRRLE